jgi:hypothetical protein
MRGPNQSLQRTPKAFGVAHLVLVRPMKRIVISFIAAAILSSCAAAGEIKRRVVIAGQASCIRHRIPLISVRGFEAKPGTLVHDADPRSPQCGERTPNRILDRLRLARTWLHPVRSILTYCTVCEAEYTECLIGYHPSDADIQQISAILSRRRDIHKPIIRIVGVEKNRVLVDAGRQEHAGDIFDDVGLTKREKRWHVSSPINAHRILATGAVLR